MNINTLLVVSGIVGTLFTVTFALDDRWVKHPELNYVKEDIKEVKNEISLYMLQTQENNIRRDLYDIVEKYGENESAMSSYVRRRYRELKKDLINVEQDLTILKTMKGN